MWSLCLLLALSQTPRHLAVAPAEPDQEAGPLELSVRDALRAALPQATVETKQDFYADLLHGKAPGTLTPADAAAGEACGCAFGEDGLVIARKIELGSHRVLKLSFFQPGRLAAPVEVEVPLDRGASAAAVRELLAKL